MTLLKALVALGAFADAKRICKEALHEFDNDYDFQVAMYITKELHELRKSEMKDMEKKKWSAINKQKRYVWENTGMASAAIKYPWIPSKFLNRDQALIDRLNDDLKQYSNCLEIKESVMLENANSRAFSSVNNCLGMFATRDIQPQEVIFSCKGPLAASPVQMRGHCYNCYKQLTIEPWTIPCCKSLKFCSSQCLDLAEKYYHKILCGKDFTHLFENAARSIKIIADPANAKLLWLRTLAICLQHGGHPLENPLLAPLASQYSTEHQYPWSLESHVIGPIKILQDFGVDVWANQDYDAWVLQTIWGRLRCNGTSELKPFWAFDVNPFYPFFNHSCDMFPRISRLKNPPMSTLRHFHSVQLIEKGEEVFDPLGNDQLLCKCECAKCAKKKTTTRTNVAVRRVGRVPIIVGPSAEVDDVAREVLEGTYDGPEDGSSSNSANSALANATADQLTEQVNSVLAAAGMPYQL